MANGHCWHVVRCFAFLSFSLSSASCARFWSSDASLPTLPGGMASSMALAPMLGCPRELWNFESAEPEKSRSYVQVQASACGMHRCVIMFECTSMHHDVWTIWWYVWIIICCANHHESQAHWPRMAEGSFPRANSKVSLAQEKKQGDSAILCFTEPVFWCWNSASAW